MADSVADPFSLSFEEQIQFFRKKTNLPTSRWDDLWQAAHDRAFMVAGVMKGDLLSDLRDAVAKVVAGGTTLETFRGQFREIVARHGWTGWTGEGTPGGFAWRTRVIYETNLRTSYAAGRWRQLNDPSLLKVRPYWRYVHNDSVLHPRPLHQQWGDERLTLPADHPFWKTHFPPNGWGCRCRVTAVTAPKQGDATAPPDGWDAVVPKTGAPPGIDKGWAYAPGSNADTSLRQMVQDKLITFPPAITKALTRDANRYINANQDPAEFVQEVLADTTRQEPLWLGFVEDPERLAALLAHDLTGYTVLLPADAPRHVQRSHGHDGGDQRPPVANDYRELIAVLNQADNVVLGQTAPNGNSRFVVSKTAAGETLRVVFELRPRQRSLAVVSLVVKRG